MTAAPVLVAVERLYPHPDNPRLVVRQDVVDGIAAAIKNGFPAKYALNVRPFGDGFQVIAGHHRRLAAIQAGLKAVPCWIEEMDDETAFLELVRSNRQSELSALERGMHALKSGMDTKAYAAAVQEERTKVQRGVMAARVAAVCNIAHADLDPRWLHLAEIHATASWLWPALVRRMVEAGWNVETTRTNAGRLKDVPKADLVPSWADLDAIAEDLAAGVMKPNDVAAMIASAKNAAQRMAEVGFHAGTFQRELQERLEGERPASLSATRAICSRVLGAQADAKRRHEEEEEARKLAALEAAEKAERKAASLRKAVTLEQWKQLDQATRQTLLSLDPSFARRSFVKQKNADIEWAMWSHNPVTGCLHNCPYCYARDIAENKMRRDLPQVYPEGFVPTFHPDAVQTARFVRLPKEAETDHRYRNVFLCSMADLYGGWVPREWIEAILSECREASDWNFLCLTKYPKKMAQFDIPENVWMGTTVDVQERVAAAEAGFAKINSKVRWLSVEPMLEPLKFKRLDLFDWVVIGGASAINSTPGYPGTPDWRPPVEWVHDLYQQARDAGCKVYMKTNLLGEGANRTLELPFDAPVKHDWPQEAPAEFDYLGRGKNSNPQTETA